MGELDRTATGPSTHHDAPSALGMLLGLPERYSAPLLAEAERHGVAGQVVVRQRVTEIEDYLTAADLGLPERAPPYHWLGREAE